MTIKFIHTGDIHFGVENYGTTDPETGLHARFKDFISCFDKIVHTAIKQEVDFILICGDIYHTPNPSPTHQREFARSVMRIIEKNIPVIVIVGNHDNPVAFGKANSLDIFTELNIKNIHVISKPDIITLDLKEKGKIQIFCFPWPTKSRLIDKEDYKHLNSQEIDEKLQKTCNDTIEHFIVTLSPQYPSIFAGHLAMADATYSGSERTTLLGTDPVILTGTLARKEFNYVALGHIHKYQNLNANSSPPVIYSGSIERIDFNEEHEEKGFILAELKGNDLTYRFIKTPSRPMVTIEVDVRDMVDPTWEIIEEIKRREINNAIVRIIYLTQYCYNEPLRLKDIKDTLEGAFWVHGIIRKPDEKEVTERAVISENLTFLEALDKYIEQENLSDYSEDIKNYAQLLERHLLEEYDSKRII
jgi:exonuclease SbcD